MGIDINMSVGIGIHITEKQVNKWLEKVDPEGDYGVWESLEYYIYSGDHPNLSFDWVGNAWIGTDHGVVIWWSPNRKSFDMGREAQSGIYEPSVDALPLHGRNELNVVAKDITGSHLPIKPYVTVTVS